MRVTKAQRRALKNMAACGFSTADLCGVSERTMESLARAGLAMVSPPYRVRNSTQTEYGITMAGRKAVMSASQ